MKLILASNNKNKLREVREILSPLGYDVISQSEAGADFEADENGTTFEENAEIKARAIYDMYKCPVIADDSGLSVDALNGAPGIYSARYAEEGKRCLKILSEMENSRSIIPSSMRFFRYTLVFDVSSISDFILISFSFVFPRATASIMEL